MLISGEVIPNSIFSLEVLNFRTLILENSLIISVGVDGKLAFLLSPYLTQASKDAARYPVAAKVAELLVRGLVSSVSSFLFSW